MDLMSIIGPLLAIGLILFGQHLEGGHIGSILQPTAALIVFGGTIGAVMLQFPGPILKDTLSAIKTIFKPSHADLNSTIAKFVELAKKARRDGLVSIEKEAAEVPDPFMRRALELAVDGTESKALRAALEIELTRSEEHGEWPVKVLEAAGGYFPTVGIIGAVLGLIHVMENLSDPSKLGGGIAVAFVATVYGVGAANLVVLPMSGKLKVRHVEHMAQMELTVEGSCAIAEGEHPRLVEKKLAAYADKRKSGGSAEEAAGAAADAARGVA
ncbi:MAG: flagellar motor protein [Deltaproteobacteria bacterium]|nr:flagellar motor protein [Deltaproteobacteria bacterium]